MVVVLLVSIFLKSLLCCVDKHIYAADGVFCGECCEETSGHVNRDLLTAAISLTAEQPLIFSRTPAK